MPTIILLSLFLVAGCTEITTSQPVHTAKTWTHHASNANKKISQQTLSQDGIPIVNLMGNKGAENA